MKIGIIGIGLIGGSIAKELKMRSLGTITVLGVDKNLQHVTQAIELGLVDEMVSEDKVFEEADVIILATPVNVIKEEVSRLLDKTRTDQVLMDTGSTKRFICQAISDHPNRKRFVAAHPLAGTEFSGPEAAI